MSTNIGRITKVGIGVESTWGTKASSITYIPVLDFNPNQNQERVMDESGIGRIEKPLENEIVREWSEPSLSCIVYSEVVGTLMKAIFGTVSTSADDPESGVNTHSFSVKNDNTPVSLTIVYKNDNQTKMCTGCIVNTADFQIVQNDFIKLDLTFMGKFPADTTETPSYTAENLFTGTMGTIKSATAIAGLSGATAICIQEMSLSINKNASLEEFYCVGASTPNSASNKQLEVTGEITKVFTDETYFDLVDAGTDHAFSISIANTGVTIGASSNPTLSFELAPCAVQDWSEGTGLDDVKTETFSIMGQYSQSDSKMISAELINTTASY